MKHIGIITGGNNEEREISLLSGKAVVNSLKKSGHKTYWYDILSDLKTLYKDLEKNKLDFCFVMGHGKGFEDGQIVSILDYYNMNYQCAPRNVLALTMNKHRTKTVWKSYGLPLANDFLLEPASNSFKDIEKQILCSVSYPCVRKQLEEGSSKGVYIINSRDDLLKVYEIYKEYYSPILVEEFIDGQEITISVLEIDGKPTVLPIIHIIPPEEGGFDFENKYNGKSLKICPPDFDEQIIQKCEEIALKAFSSVGCKKYGRIDAILTKSGPILLEINTIPGFTPESLFPKSASKIGLSFEKLLETLMK